MWNLITTAESISIFLRRVPQEYTVLQGSPARQTRAPTRHLLETQHRNRKVSEYADQESADRDTTSSRLHHQSSYRLDKDQTRPQSRARSLRCRLPRKQPPTL